MIESSLQPNVAVVKTTKSSYLFVSCSVELFKADFA